MAREELDNTIALSKTTKFVVDNRGRTAPTSEEGVLLIATNCISNDQLYPSYDAVRRVSVETHRRWFRSHPEPGDIILTLKGSQNGAVCLVPDPVDFAIAQDMVALRADERVIDPLFLFAALRSPQVQWQIKNLDVSGVIPHFKKTDFDKLMLPYPSRAVQEQVGRIYYYISAKIEQNRRTGRKLEELARAVFKAWFVDFEPVKAKAKGSTASPGMPPETFASLPNTLKDSPLGPVPEGWEVKPLSAICKLVSGGTPKRSEPSFWDGNVPWYSVKDAPADGMPWVYFTDEQITQKGLDESAANLVPAGCTIISARGTVGKLAMAGREMTFNQSCYGLLPSDGRSFRYLNLLMNDTVVTLQQRTHGSVFDTITRQTFDGIQVVMPPAAVVEIFDRAVTPIFDLQLAQLKESAKLAALRDYLLPRLLSGKVRVRESERLSLDGAMASL